MNKTDKTKDLDLSLTMQQKFNFDSKKIEDEINSEKKLYKKRSEIIFLKKKILKLEKIKNRYMIYIRILISCLLLFIIGISYLYYNHIKYEPKIVTKTVTKYVGGENIVFVGDSITYQYNLKDYYDDKYHLVNSGIDGNTTSDILNDMENRIYRYNPTKVVLLIGTNDVPYKSEKEIENNIKTIIDNIIDNRPNCEIYLESIYPVNDTDDEKISHDMVRKRKNEKIMNINKNLKSLAKNEKKVTYINMYDYLLDENGNLKIEYTKEGLHLNNDGYKVVTKVLKENIKMS